jgi:hypothetical protein
MVTVYKCDKCGGVTRESEVTAYTPEGVMHLCGDCWSLFSRWVEGTEEGARRVDARETEFNFPK